MFVGGGCSDSSSFYGDGCMQMAVVIVLMISMMCIIVMWSTGLADVTATETVNVVNEQTVMAAMSFAFARECGCRVLATILTVDDLSNVTAAVTVLHKQTVMGAMSFTFAEAVVVISLLHFLLWMIFPI